MSKKFTEEVPLVRSRLNPDGSEVPDPRPMALPIGFERPEPIGQLIRRLVQDPAFRAEMDANDLESFDDADDFDVPGDDIPPFSPHEDKHDPMHLLAREQEVRSGTVRERTPEEVTGAERVLAERREAVAKRSNRPSGNTASEKPDGDSAAAAAVR